MGTLDKRRYTRVRAVNTVQVLDVVSEIETRSISTIELGPRGCLLRTPQPLGIGRVLVLNIDIKRGEVRVISKVLYEYPDGDGATMSGVEFLFIEPEEQVLLDRYLDTLYSPENPSG